MPFSIDIEVTNRCNAKCHFCPRDRTPHQGLMTEETFRQSLARAVEFRDAISKVRDDVTVVSLCGLGEPLLHPKLAHYVSLVVAEGFEVTVSSNGSLLTEEKGRELLDAGLHKIFLNVGEEGDDYEAVYHLPFERTLDRVVRFNEMADEQGTCEVTVVLVDHRDSAEHVERMRAYWASKGVVHTHSYEVMNRGGSLFIDHMQYQDYDELAQARAVLQERTGTPLCAAPLMFLFIGYDGQYYLCCSDWEKQAPMGSVFEKSLVDVTADKLQHLASREPVCVSCNLDPINRLTEEIRAEARGEVPAGSADALLESLVTGNVAIRAIPEQLGFAVPVPAPTRRTIPVRAG